MKNEVRVRFAPSNTGLLHIGVARTAIFNWLFVRKYNGKFLVRVEDTDVERSTEEFTQDIINSLKWLGLDIDEEIVFQSKNLEEHKKRAYKLLEDGCAYRCFCTPDEIDIRRKETEKGGKRYIYDRKCLNLSEEQIKENLGKKMPFALRFYVPEGGTEFEDGVYGLTKYDNSEIEDFVLLRSTGMPTYQLAVVVDDISMNVTHVIRGNDHLSNTPKQIMIYKALGALSPVFAHVPMILGPDKQKLSKRHGSVSVTEYRKKGYLPDPLVNFLAFLGWSPGTEQEIFTIPELIQVFSVERISKKAAIFDERKLEEKFSHTYISNIPVEDFLMEIRQYYEMYDPDFCELITDNEEYLEKVAVLLQGRIKRLNEFKDFGIYFFKDPEEYDEKTAGKRWKEKTGELMTKFLDTLEKVENFSLEGLEDALREFAEKEDLSAAQIIHPSRLALSGMGIGPGIFDIFIVLGKDTSIKRIKKAIDTLG
jgi:glutamyl-tRNA synthetase